MKKAREWWIDSVLIDKPNTKYAYTNIQDADDRGLGNITHVIEKRAFDELLAQAEAMAEALRDCLDTMCPHTESMRRLSANANLQRDFCSCSSWVYRNSENPASKALNSWQKFEEKL